ncbi:excalibur calcium-binding domain-containing protein [Rheinheimera sp. 1928-s]|uniref:excalibur calcium-binding domain-containing protein n=1 Tax=Rheinheimera sp. 1928-s TaxID=3033803 RepID=UPI002634EAF4|nr:excalibur calcium-binding domain-containing protein [Rheinheimera sp. 1928-s]MDF3126741.1 excalibur calcium-binding domain-containing protein [Rheinheimera sp. 1928-s]
MLHQGKLKDWDPARGTGFLQQDKAGPDIRISSAGFRKKPDQLKNGDQIFFQIEIDPEGKTKAVSAYKAGQHFAPAPELKKPALSTLPFQQLFSVVLVFSVLIWLGSQSVHLFSAQTEFPVQTGMDQGETEELQHATALSDRPVLDSPVWPPIQNQQDEQFQCEGKQHCSEMVSCDEAKFYLKNCPDVLIDGDNDGIPCERQHCGHRRF